MNISPYKWGMRLILFLTLLVPPLLGTPSIVTNVESHIPQKSLIDTIIDKSKNSEYFKSNIKSSELSNVECLSFALYGEARGESKRGILGVAFVVHNRSVKWDKDYCTIIKNRSQFNFYITTPKNENDIESWNYIVSLSNDLINENGFAKIISPVDGAMYFNSLTDQSEWTKRKLVATIGNHYFYI